MKIIFFGTPEFAVESLKAILENGYDVAAVVTMPDRTGGRGNKVIESDLKKFAVERGLRVLQPEKLRDPEFLKTLDEIAADLYIVIAFRMLPKTVWEKPRLGTFNLHASLLPQLRGAAPINHAIISGLDTTGVTTFLINEEIDKGNILLSSRTSIEADETAGSLHDRLMTMGAKLVIDTIRGLEEGCLVPKPQDESMPLTPAPKIFKENCRIDFNKSAVEIDRLVRGLCPYPCAWTTLELDDGRRIDAKILETRISDKNTMLTPGQCEVKGKTLTAGSSDGAIEIVTIQPAGKKPMDISAFLAGYHPKSFI